MIVALFAALIIALLLLSVLVSWRLGAKNPNPAKYDRYEAGNPPTGEPKGRLAMQYFGFLILLTGSELIALTPAIMYVATGDQSLIPVAVAAPIIVAILAIWGSRKALRIEEWQV